MINKSILIKLRELKFDFTNKKLQRIREKENDTVTTIKIENVSDLIYAVEFLLFKLEDKLLNNDIETFEEIFEKSKEKD
jgi:hypothetical protein